MSDEQRVNFEEFKHQFDEVDQAYSVSSTNANYINNNPVMLFKNMDSHEDKLRALREVINPADALRTGHSGWVGYDMFCAMNIKASVRNTKLLSKSHRSTSQALLDSSTPQKPSVNENSRLLKAPKRPIELDTSPRSGSGTNFTYSEGSGAVKTTLPLRVSTSMRFTVHSVGRSSAMSIN